MGNLIALIAGRTFILLAFLVPLDAITRELSGDYATAPTWFIGLLVGFGVTLYTLGKEGP